MGARIVRWSILLAVCLRWIEEKEPQKKNEAVRERMAAKWRCMSS